MTLVECYLLCLLTLLSSCADGHLLCRTCSTFLSGSLGDVYLKGSGTSKFYLGGQANSLGLDLSGVSTAESAISSGNLPLCYSIHSQITVRICSSMALLELEMLPCSGSCNKGYIVVLTQPEFYSEFCSEVSMHCSGQ